MKKSRDIAGLEKGGYGGDEEEPPVVDWVRFGGGLNREPAVAAVGVLPAVPFIEVTLAP